MTMNLNDVLAAGGNYVKLKDGDSISGCFFGEFTEQTDSKFGTKYKIGFRTLDGEELIYSGSSKFFANCNEKAAAAGLGFYNTKFRISRTGSTMSDTRYNQEVIVDGQTLPPVQQPAQAFYDGGNNGTGNAAPF